MPRKQEVFWNRISAVYDRIIKNDDTAYAEVSSPGESHPQALSEPDVNLSAHPAPIIQPQDESPFANVRTTSVLVWQSDQANK